MDLDAIVLGAGPAGLSTASALARRGGSVAVIDPAARAGGAVHTVKEDGWRVELGPNTLQLESKLDADLLGELSLAKEIQEADVRGAKRLIANQGHIHALTSNPRSILNSELLSWRGKFNLLLEVFQPRESIQGETVRSFAERRFGTEVADRLFDPMINGIHAGDPGRLVLEYAFPSLARLESDHRSILLGLWRSPSEPRKIVQFAGGLHRLTEAMVGQLPKGALHLQSTTTLIRRDSRGWNVAWRNALGEESGAHAKSLIITAPPWQWAHLACGEILKPVLHAAEIVEAPPVALVVRGYERGQVQHPLDAFGLLVPHSEGRKVLGVLFPSSTFPNNTPDGSVQLACFIGGARNIALGRLDDDQLREVVDAELGDLLGVKGAPKKEWIARWPRAIPQYTRQHGRFLEALAATEALHSGLHFVGSFRGGISLMSTLRRGSELGSRLPRG